MHQGGRLQRLAGLLLGQLLGRQLAQLVVDQRQELLGRLRVALLDGREDAGHVGHRHGFHWPIPRRPRPGLEERCSETFHPGRRASRDGSAPA